MHEPLEQLALATPREPMHTDDPLTGKVLAIGDTTHEVLGAWTPNRQYLVLADGMGGTIIRPRGVVTRAMAIEFEASHS